MSQKAPIPIVCASWYFGKYESNLYGSVNCSWSLPYDYLDSTEMCPLANCGRFHLAAYSMLHALRCIQSTTNIARVVLAIKHRQLYEAVESKKASPKMTIVKTIRNMLSQLPDVSVVYIERDYGAEPEIYDLSDLNDDPDYSKDDELANRAIKLIIAEQIKKSGAKCLRRVKKNKKSSL